MMRSSGHLLALRGRAAVVTPRWFHRQKGVTTPRSPVRCWASSIGSTVDSVPAGPRSVAVVGGGLAGLAVVWELLERAAAASTTTTTASSKVERIRVYDVVEGPGVGGASAVAGGLVHPLSPRGKLVYQGMQGLEATHRLIDASIRASSSGVGDTASNTIVVCDSIRRVAQTMENERQLQATAQQLPHVCTWLTPEQVKARSSNGANNSTTIRGALELSGLCRVVHVPSYLQALWNACRLLASQHSISLEWIQMKHPKWSRSENHQTVVWTAGAALFQEYFDPNDFPVHLVRGQSLELVSFSSSEQPFSQALLCGKYVSPLPDTDGTKIPRRVLVGATHEYSPHPMPSGQVWTEMKRSTEFMCPQVWNDNQYQLQRITSGYRVQSQRGANGRLPLLGKLPNGDWIYTGLSSRGLLYHALFAQVMVDAVWNNDETLITQSHPELAWWKKNTP